MSLHAGHTENLEVTISVKAEIQKKIGNYFPCDFFVGNSCLGTCEIFILYINVFITIY